MSKLFISQGKTADAVEQDTNQTGKFDTIMTVTPERGTFLRIVNAVATGDALGVPVYADLRDANGDPLPVNSRLEWRLTPAGQSQAMKVSETVESIGDYNRLSLKEQRNTDHVDAVKHVFTTPEAQGGRRLDPRNQPLDFRDIDQLELVLDSEQAIDWSQSEVYVDASAVKGPFDRS